jgi:heme exporter protein D
MREFLAMGGYGLYIWGAYGIAALAILVEVLALRGRTRAALDSARSTPIDTEDTAGPARAGYTTAGETR